MAPDLLAMRILQKSSDTKDVEIVARGHERAAASSVVGSGRSTINIATACDQSAEELSWNDSEHAPNEANLALMVNGYQ